MLSIGALAVELALLLVVFLYSRKPPVPGKVRVFPYTPAIIFLVILIFLTCAHIISLLTGTQVQPRKPKGMR
jgi:hypothetical protein